MTRPSAAGTVLRAGEADWARVRAVRLAALADAPDSFMGTLAAEQDWDEGTWRTRVRSTATVLALVDGQVDGQVVGTATGERHRDEHHLTGMWVAPAMRGRGVSGALVEAVTGWAREQGAPRLYLWVIDGNEAARRLYARHGFAPTGREQPLPPRPWQHETQFARPLP